MQDLKEKIKELASKYSGDIIDIRRHLHAHPELSFQEYETSRYVFGKLSEIGLTPMDGIADTGITAIIEGKDPEKKVVALRADMDALPIMEENDVPYRSRNNGIMHACGHDAHTASLLGTARILVDLREHFTGSVKLIFQPGEEKAPGGASRMIEDGILRNPVPGAIFGQHVMPQLPIGKIGFKPGLYMASADEIYMKIKGKGGHAAMPDKNVDPILIGSHILIALQQIVSRHSGPEIPTVLSFGKFIANGATNIIPDEVYIEGTFRTLNEDWRYKAHKNMKRMAESIARGMGGDVEFTVLKGYPLLHNDELLTEKARKYAADFIGEENIVELGTWMAAEDFAFYSQQVEACFYRLGVSNHAKGIDSMVHTPTFNIDENALELGSGLMAWITVNYLNS